VDTVLELQATLNSKGRTHAAALIKRGAVSKSRSWDGPSPAAENSYLEDHSWAEYGAWFLGVDNEVNPESKGHYKYPFADDFKTVSVNGLRAIRGRAGQTDEKEIFNAAGPLFDAAKEKLGMSDPSSVFEMRARFQNMQAFRAVDSELGTMSDVSILEEGEAKGHGVLITRKTLKGAATALQGKSLPSYITHANAQGDRLTTEVGFFSGFYLDIGQRAEDRENGPKSQYKLKARTFQAFNAFRDFQPEAYARLFEMAQVLPENFGVSLVFEARLFWQMSDETEMEFEGWDDVPDGSEYELPTVEVVRVMSADFVDNPAANSSLFSTTHNGEKQAMEIELTTAASEKLEQQKKEAGELEAPAKAKPATEAAEPKKKKKKKFAIPVELLEDADVNVKDEILEGDELLNKMDIDQDEESVIVAQLETRLSERDKLIGDMNEKVETLTKEVETLRELFSGAEPVAEDAAEEVTEEVNFKALKEQALQEVMTANAGMTKSCALLEVGKRHPEYFNN